MTESRVRLAWALFALAGLLTLGHGVLVLVSSSPLVSQATGAFPFLALGTVLAAWVGMLVATRYPSNPVGWLLLGGQVCAATGLLFQAYSYCVFVDRMFGSLTSGQVARLAAIVLGRWTLLALALTFLFFPDGRLVSRRWRPAVWIAPVSGVLVVVAMTLVPLGAVPRPGALPAAGRPVVLTLERVSSTLMWLLLVLGVASLLVRRRRTTPLGRQQLRWLAVAAGFLVLSLALAHLTSGGPGWRTAPVLAAFVAVPVAAGVAILRYRLYDIDIVISRAVVGGAVLAFVTGGYVIVVVVVGAVLGGQVSSASWVSVLATSVVALAFQPVRGRLRRLGDRVVYGRRATPYEALAELSRQLAESPAAEDVLPVVAEATAASLGAASVCVTLEVPGGPHVVVRSPDGPPAARIDEAVPVWHGAERLGEIAVTLPPGRRMTDGDRGLLADIATEAGLGFRNAQLVASLSAGIEESVRQATALEASRRRLLAAQESQRQRLVRAVRVDVLPHLDAARDALAPAAVPARAGSPVESAALHVDRALEAVRDLARGVYPPVLARRGLVDALTDYVDQRAARLQLEVSEAARRRTGPAQTQAMVYFCAVEAARELGAAALELDERDDELVLVVTAATDGSDFADGGRDLVDRVEACAGLATVDRDPAGHARLRVSFPMTASAAVPREVIGVS